MGQDHYNGGGEHRASSGWTINRNARTTASENHHGGLSARAGARAPLVYSPDLAKCDLPGAQRERRQILGNHTLHGICLTHLRHGLTARGGAHNGCAEQHDESGYNNKAEG
ncbi:hypothetical protein BG841_07430 [Marinobacter sp. X15-166B]|nr:hypothetical protein BG841_07430 [Marinobacter sp. X15-166B]